MVQRAERPKTPFDQVPLVVVAKLRERRVVEDLRDDGESYVPPKLHQEYRLLRFAVRINKPAASDPNSDRSLAFLLERTPGVPFNLEFGRDYVLFLKRSEDALVGPDSLPLYTVALADVGFELGSKTVRVLRRGGPLTAYDGHPSEEVLRSIDPQYVDQVWRRAHPKD
jgi:hypothetical protein